MLVSDEAPGLYDSSSLEQVHVENSLDPYLVKYIAEVLSDRESRAFYSSSIVLTRV